MRAREHPLPSMSEVASACGISRQALYLHFSSRAALITALVDHADRDMALPEGIATVEAAPDGPAKVRAWAQMQADRNPRIAVLARALDDARSRDEAAQAAWADRMGNRLRGATGIVVALQHDGLVGRGWTDREAALLLAEVLSFRVWDDLVNDAGVEPGRYVQIVTATALAALAASVDGG
jgi:AcrR family transcriptional regulator